VVVMVAPWYCWPWPTQVPHNEKLHSSTYPQGCRSPMLSALPTSSLSACDTRPAHPPSPGAR